MTTSAQGLTPGTRMGRYELLHRLAMGGMAELYVARQSGIHGFERTVAVKRVLPHLTQDPEFVRMLVDEARIAAALDHPNVAQVTDIGEENGECFLAMEYVHGQNLRELLKREPQGLPMGLALTIVSGVAAGLHHAHEALGPDGRSLGLVHRDVSPSNVMVAYNGGVKLTDFGIAKAYALTSKTLAGNIKGKVGYMSPEQCRAEQLDRRSDIFALGIVLYEATTGARAFYAPNAFAAMARIAQSDFVRPRELDPDYPEELERIIERALQKDPADRYATVEEMLVELEAYAERGGYVLSSVELGHYMQQTFGTPAHPQTIALPERPVVEPRRRSGRPGVMIAAVIGVAALGTGVAWAVGHDAPPPAAVALPPAPESPPRQEAPPPEPHAAAEADAEPEPPQAEPEVDAPVALDDAESAAGAEPDPAEPDRRGRKRGNARKRKGAKEKPFNSGRSPYPPGYKR